MTPSARQDAITWEPYCSGCYDRLDNRGHVVSPASKPAEHDHKIVTVTHGKRTIAGTDWPIESYLERTRKPYGPGGRGRWLVTWDFCNGIPSGATRFATRWEALEALGIEEAGR